MIYELDLSCLGSPQINSREDDYAEKVNDEHDPVYGLGDEVPPGEVHLLCRADIVGTRDVQGFHVDCVISRRREL